MSTGGIRCFERFAPWPILYRSCASRSPQAERICLLGHPCIDPLHRSRVSADASTRPRTRPTRYYIVPTACVACEPGAGPQKQRRGGIVLLNVTAIHLSDSHSLFRLPGPLNFSGGQSGHEILAVFAACPCAAGRQRATEELQYSPLNQSRTPHCMTALIPASTRGGRHVFVLVAHAAGHRSAASTAFSAP